MVALPAIVIGNRCRIITLVLGNVREQALSWKAGALLGSGRRQLNCFRRRVVRNDGEDRRLAGSRSLGPTPADALSVVPATPSPATSMIRVCQGKTHFS